MKDRTLDLPEAARRAAVRMVRMPSKVCRLISSVNSQADTLDGQGTTLLGLLNLYPFLVTHVRNEILRHEISIDLLKPADSADPSRPLYSSHRPSFLSPIAFDYENADRFTIDLGPTPWVEGCYSADPPPCSPPSEFAESVWPLKPKHYYVGEGDKRKDLGCVTGDVLGNVLDELSTIPSGELAEWTRDRVPKGSLPVAIALLASEIGHLAILSLTLCAHRTCLTSKMRRST